MVINHMKFQIFRMLHFVNCQVVTDITE